MQQHHQLARRLDRQLQPRDQLQDERDRNDLHDRQLHQRCAPQSVCLRVDQPTVRYLEWPLRK